MKRLVLILIMVFVVFSTFSDENATTTTGKKVLLEDDGTWEYVDVTKVILVRLSGKQYSEMGCEAWLDQFGDSIRYTEWTIDEPIVALSGVTGRPVGREKLSMEDRASILAFCSTGMIMVSIFVLAVSLAW